jgi:hypothetical protein
MKFKVGDKVIIVKRNSNNRTGLLDWDKPNGDVGNEGYIVKIIDERLYKVYLANIDSTYLGIFSDNELEHIDVERPKYKLIKEYPGSPNLGEIVEYPASDAFNCIKFPEYWEKVIPEFKVGDIVVVEYSGTHYSTHPDRRVIDGIGYNERESLTNNSILRVLAVNQKFHNCDNVLVLTDNDQSYWFGYDSVQDKSNFRLATASEIDLFNNRNIVKRLGEYTVSSNNNSIKVGCQKYTIEDIKAAKRVVTLNQGYGITIRGIEVTMDILNKFEKMLSCEVKDIPVVVGTKFKHNNKGVVYRVSNISGDDVTISWDEDSDYPRKVDYKLANVQDSFNNGIWVKI